MRNDQNGGVLDQIGNVFAGLDPDARPSAGDPEKDRIWNPRACAFMKETRAGFPRLPGSPYPVSMQVVLPDFETRATFQIQAERPMDDTEFFEFCAKNPGLRIERAASGDIIIMPPAGFETGYRNNEVCRQLGNWARADGRGIALESNTEYVLPDGAALSPDASWVLKSRLMSFTKEQKRHFLPLCPDLVVELTSPTDRLPTLKAKMRTWIENGAQLGWLIDADRRTIYIYRPGQAVEELTGVDQISGEGPVGGFHLELADIWRGL